MRGEPLQGGLEKFHMELLNPANPRSRYPKFATFA